MIKVTIVEDEKNIQETIQRILSEYCRETEVTGIASDVNSSVELLKNSDTDLALLDISIPGGTTFDVLKQLGKVNFKIIFITAHEEYALQAIKFSAFDYLLKPIDPLELIQAVGEASKVIREETTDVQLSTLLTNINMQNKTPQTIILKTSESIHLTKISDISRCESDSSYTTFYLNSGKHILVSKTLKEYDELLSVCGFFRVHQSHLVNLRQIDRFEKGEGGYLVMKDEATIPVSHRKKDALLKAFEAIGNF